MKTHGGSTFKVHPRWWGTDGSPYGLGSIRVPRVPPGVPLATHKWWPSGLLCISLVFLLAHFLAAVEPPTANPESSIQNPSSNNPPSTLHPPPSNPADSGKNHPGPGDLLFRSGQYDKALPLYQQQLASASDAETGARALFHIGQCLTVLHRYAEAVGAFDNLLVKFPTSSWTDDTMLRKGAVQAGLLKNPQAGIATWLELLKKYPKSNLTPEARFLAGMLDWIGGQKSRAKETWRVLIREFPDHPRAEQARLYLGEKRP